MKKSLAITILSAILFSVLVLWPFSIRSNHLFATLGSDLPIAGCVAGTSDHGLLNVSKTNQCVSWETPPLVKSVGILSVLAVAVLAGLILRREATGKSEERRKLVQINLIVALVSTAGTLTAYYFMRHASQAHYVAANLVPPDLDTGKLVPIHLPALGYGLTPPIVVVLTALYLLAPFVIWYRMTYSRKYVGGIKKKELFQ